MEDRIAKLEAFMQTSEAEAAFFGTPEEVLENLKKAGIDLTLEELKAFAQGVKDAQNDELTEEDLTDVAGGATYAGYDKDCYNAGRKLCKVLKWVFKIGILFV